MEVVRSTPPALILRHNSPDAAFVIAFFIAVIGIVSVAIEEDHYCVEWHGVLVKRIEHTDSDGTSYSYVVRIGKEEVVDPPGWFDDGYRTAGQRLIKRCGSHSVDLDRDSRLDENSRITHGSTDVTHLLLMMIFPGFSLFAHAIMSRRIIINRVNRKIELEYWRGPGDTRSYDEYNLRQHPVCRVEERKVQSEDGPTLVYDLLLSGIVECGQLTLLSGTTKEQAESLQFEIDRYLTGGQGTGNLAASKDIRFIDPALPAGVITRLVVVNNGTGTCQVCGSSMKTDVVQCPACSTPHHRECWEYNGRCSTYACGGR